MTPSTASHFDDSRGLLESLFHEAIAAANPMRVVASHLPRKPKGRLLNTGVGKASARMAEAVEAHYGPCEGLIITRCEDDQPTLGIEIAVAAHPVPNAAG